MSKMDYTRTEERHIITVDGQVTGMMTLRKYEARVFVCNDNGVNCPRDVGSDCDGAQGFSEFEHDFEALSHGGNHDFYLKKYLEECKK